MFLVWTYYSEEHATAPSRVIGLKMFDLTWHMIHAGLLYPPPPFKVKKSNKRPQTLASQRLFKACLRS